MKKAPAGPACVTRLDQVHVLLTGGHPLLMSTRPLGGIIERIRETGHVRIVPGHPHAAMAAAAASGAA